MGSHLSCAATCNSPDPHWCGSVEKGRMRIDYRTILKLSKPYILKLSKPWPSEIVGKVVHMLIFCHPPLHPPDATPLRAHPHA